MGAVRPRALPSLLQKSSQQAGEVSDLQGAGCSLTTVPPQEPQGSESVSMAPFLLTGVHLAAPAAGSLGGRHGTEAQG